MRSLPVRDLEFAAADLNDRVEDDRFRGGLYVEARLDAEPELLLVVVDLLELHLDADQSRFEIPYRPLDRLPQFRLFKLIVGSGACDIGYPVGEDGSLHFFKPRVDPVGYPPRVQQPLHIASDRLP